MKAEILGRREWHFEDAYEKDHRINGSEKKGK